MWRSQVGSKEVKTITQADDDDWDTDPDFVVSKYFIKAVSVKSTCKITVLEVHT